MVRVLIADDEVRVCSLIQALVDWPSLDMEIVGTAHNGVEALSLVEQEKPDLVITDIRMPGCSGLEMIEQTRKLCPEIAFIIISGYTQFEYAQLAIKFGVSDYLLKPIDQQELLSTLKRVRADVEERRREQARADRMRRAFYSDQRKVRACWLMDVLAGRSLFMDLEEINREYRYAFRPGLFQGFGVKLDYAPESCDEAAVAAVSQRVRETILGRLRGLCTESELWFENGLGMGVCNFSAGCADRVRACLDECLAELERKRETFPQMTFSISAAPPVPETAAAETVLTARRLLDERLVRGSGKVLDRLPELAGVSLLKLAGDFMQRLRPALERGDTAAAREAVDELQEQTMQARGITGRELLKVVTMAGEKALEECAPAEQAEVLLSAFHRRCGLCATADQLFCHLAQMVCRLAELLRESRVNDEARPLRQAQLFLEQHYMENITLEQVAGMVGFNASYFSALFKKKCGVGFQDYLTALRIQRAKELLTQTDEPISEICYRVGYKDVKHFGKLFRKATNLRPGEFKKLYGRLG